MSMLFPRRSRWQTSATLAVLGSAVTAARGQLVSFPGAVGFGAATTGGRAGNVYVVTNLNDSGTGSFRDAVSQSNRTVVFAVGGYVHLLSPVSIKSNLTIEGQTAPGDGIGIMGAEASFTGSSNDVIRYVRFRDGSIDPNWPGTGGTNSSTNAINLGDTHNMIFDHVSAEFAAYNNVDAHGNTGAFNLTFQNSIIADPIKAQQFNFHLEGGGPATFVNNVFANAHNRSILAKDDLQYVNNVVYNYQAGFTTGNSAGNFRYDILNNYFIAGPSTSSPGDAWYQLDANQSAYASGNLLDSNKDGTLSGSATAPGGLVPLSSPWSPTTANLPLLGAAAAYQYDVAHAGPSLHYDQVDAQILGQVKSLGTQGSILNTETGTGLSNGGFGVINGGTAPADTNNNGIADAWETAHGLSLSNAGGYKLLNPLGYTMLEQYANELADANVSTKVWTSNGGDWNTAAKWTDAVPGVYDGAAIQGDGAGADGLVTVTSASGAPQLYQLSIGGNGGAAGEKLVVGSGGALDVNDTITVGSRNTGTLEIDGGTVTATNVQLGNTVNGTTYTGSLVLNGGTLQTSQIVLGGGSPGSWTTGGSIAWNGGTVQATGTLNIDAPATIGAAGAVVDSNGNSGTISGALGGAGSFTKIGDGILALTASNTYTGGTVLQGGELGITTDANLGGSTSPITFQGGILQVLGTTLKNIDAHPFNASTFNGGFDVASASNTFTVSQTLGGAGSLTKTGPGTLVLTGTNTLSGGVTLGAGTLQVSADANLGANANPLTFAGGTLQIVGTALTNLNNHPIVNGDVNGTIDVNTAGNTFTINQTLNGAGGLTKAGPGVLVLAQKDYYTGDTNITGGTLRVANTLALRYTTVYLTTAAATLDLNGVNATVGGLAGTQNLDLKGSDIFVGNNNADTTYSGVVSDSVGTGSITKVGTGTYTPTGNSTYTGPTILAAGLLTLSTLTNGNAPSPLGASTNAQANLVLSGGTLQYTGAGGTTDRLFDIAAKGGSLDSSGTGTFALTNTAAITPSAAANVTLTLTGTNAGHNTFSPALADPAGGFTTSVTKTGAGKWTFNGGQKTYGGDTHVTAGTLETLGSNVLSIHSNMVIDAGATLDFHQSNQSVDGLSGAGTVTDSFFKSTDTFTIGADGGGGTFTGNLGNASLPSVVKAGAGVQVLAGTNAYTGATTVNGGVLQFNAAASIGGTGASVTVNAGGAAAAGYAINQAFLARITSSSTGAVALATSSANNLDFSAAGANLTSASLGAVGDVTYTGTLTPSGATYRLGGGNGTLTLSKLNALTGANGLEVVGPASAVALTAANNYAGTTTVTAGRLIVGANGALGSSTAVSIDPGGVLDLSTPGLTDALPTGIPLSLGSLGTTYGTVAFGSGTLNQVVSQLIVNGATEPAGTYTATSLPNYITGSGSITVPATAVPEPATAAPILLAGAVALRRRRRTR